MVPLAAGVLVLAGVILAASDTSESFVWFAYVQPDSGSGTLLMITGKMKLGYSLVAAGLLAATFWAGFRLGQRRRRTRSGPRQDPAPQD